MRHSALRAFAGNAPLPRLRIHLGPRRAARLPGSRGGQDQEPEAEFRCSTRPRRLHPLGRPGDFAIGQRPEVRLHRWQGRPIRGRPRGRSAKAKTRSRTAGRSSGSSAVLSHPVGPRGRENPARRCVLSDLHAPRRTPPRKRTASITPCYTLCWRGVPVRRSQCPRHPPSSATLLGCIHALGPSGASLSGTPVRLRNGSGDSLLRDSAAAGDRLAAPRRGSPAGSRLGRDVGRPKDSCSWRRGFHTADGIHVRGDTHAISRTRFAALRARGADRRSAFPAVPELFLRRRYAPSLRFAQRCRSEDRRSLASAPPGKAGRRGSARLRRAVPTGGRRSKPSPSFSSAGDTPSHCALRSGAGLKTGVPSRRRGLSWPAVTYRWRCRDGGGGGNRTRVRKSSATTSTCISGLWPGTRARRRLSLFRSRAASTRRIAARYLSLVLTDGSGKPPAKPA